MYYERYCNACSKKREYGGKVRDKDRLDNKPRLLASEEGRMPSSFGGGLSGIYCSLTETRIGEWRFWITCILTSGWMVTLKHLWANENGTMRTAFLCCELDRARIMWTIILEHKPLRLELAFPRSPRPFFCATLLTHASHYYCIVTICGCPICSFSVLVIVISLLLFRTTPLRNDLPIIAGLQAKWRRRWVCLYLSSLRVRHLGDGRENTVMDPIATSHPFRAFLPCYSTTTLVAGSR